jgi:hypothetical protein
LRAWWPQLTDDDWIRIAGRKEVFQEVVQKNAATRLNLPGKN